MNEKENQLETRITLAIVLRGPLSEIEELKEELEKKDIIVAYQRNSTDKLYITEEKPEGVE